MTDESLVYTRMSREFAGHGTLNHSAGEYFAYKTLHINTVEDLFSISKRGVIGTYHHMSKAHLACYFAEFDFRYASRTITDGERTTEALKGIIGERLTNRRTDRFAA